jgi:hypothetical protein
LILSGYIIINYFPLIFKTLLRIIIFIKISSVSENNSKTSNRICDTNIDYYRHVNRLKNQYIISYFDVYF